MNNSNQMRNLMEAISGRQEYRGTVVVHRSFPTSETLSAKVTLDNGNEFEYWKAPLAFVRPTQGGGEVSGNKYIATFIANPDGSRPSKVKVIKEI